MSITVSSRETVLAFAAAIGVGLSASAANAAVLDESYWYASGDPTVPDGQLWVNSAGECWQSAYPDGPNNLPPCQVEVVPEKVTVRLNFEFDKYFVPDDVVNTEELVKIDEYIDKVKATPEEEYVTIVGHTDAKGSDEYNMALGMRRADAVRDYFIAQGYPEQNLAPAVSEGKRDMLPDVDPFSVLQRRVVITKTDN